MKKTVLLSVLSAVMTVSSVYADISAEQRAAFSDANAKIKHWDVNIDFANGVIPNVAGLRNDYTVLTPDLNGKGIILEHEKNLDKGMTFIRPSVYDGKKRFYAVELVVEAISPSAKHPGLPCFQVAFRPGIAGQPNVCLNAGFGINIKDIKTPWGFFEMPSRGALKLMMLVDTHTENGMLFVNGKIFKCGKLPRLDSKPRILWGDYSASVGGSARLEYVRFTALD